MNIAKAYATELASTLTPIHMPEFFQDIHAMCYADHDISFLDYFLELINHDNEFIVPCCKLLEHNIITTEQSMDILDHLKMVGLEGELDFIVIHEVYMLTPEAYKKCLMRSSSFTYGDYYMLLEQIYKLYTDYERQYSYHLLIQKNDKIDRLVDQVNNLLTLDNNTSKLTHLVVLAPNNKTCEGRTILVRGQSTRIKKAITNHSETHIPVVNTAYDTDTNLIADAKAKCDQIIRKYILEYNKPIKTCNEKLKAEIVLHNKKLVQLAKAKTHTELIKRSYMDEKKDMICLSDIPIAFNSTYIWYKPNPHFTYDSIIQIIIDTNKTTSADAE
jgi:hypothetical protein